LKVKIKEAFEDMWERAVEILSGSNGTLFIVAGGY